jgi:prepilin-type processing-associated H-X9-DG protein
MVENVRKPRRTGGALVAVLVLVVVLVVLVGMLVPSLSICREDADRIGCRNNLNEIAKGMATYLNEYGDNCWFPYPLGQGLRRYDFCGSEWLASVYWTGLVTDPDVFVCPMSGDSNDDGRDLGTARAIPGRFGPPTVSYAGLHYYSRRDEKGNPIPGAIRDDYPPNKPMGSDDTQGDINHGTLSNGGMSILFFDSHVEFRTNTELHLKEAVGDTSPDALLTELSN